MAHAPSGLTFVLDENLGTIPTLLRQARAVSSGTIRTLPELGIPPGTSDPAVLHSIGTLKRPVLLTRDGSMLGPVVQREAWRTAGVTLFLFGGRWGTLPLGELARRLLYLWPSIVDCAEASAPGAAWRVAVKIPSIPATTFRLVTGQHGRA